MGKGGAAESFAEGNYYRIVPYLSGALLSQLFLHYLEGEGAATVMP